MSKKPQEPFMPNELTKDQFVQRMKEAGWTIKQALDEWERIQEDDESGYDGP